MTRIVKVHEWLTADIYTRRTERAKEQVTKDGWQHTFDGMAVLQETKEYLEELSKVMPNLKFVAWEDDSVVYSKTRADGVVETHRAYVIKSFLACADESPFALGYISYGDHAVDRASDLTYAVQSRRIANPKYAYHRDQHHMMMTKDLKKAIKLAKAFLTPYTTGEMATAMYEEIHNNTGRELERTKRQMMDTLDPINYNKEVIIAELLNLMRQNVEFTTPQFKDIAKVLQDRVEIYKEQADRQVSALFVRLYSVGSDTYVDVKEARDVRKTGFAKDALKDTELKTYLLADLPEDITHSIASLNILTNNQYVTNVGMKIDDRHFWVERG